jgi:hypothetical protein
VPRFLEDKLKREYPNNPGAVYGTMNAIGAMHGSKETAKGREMERKHEADMKKGMATPEPMREMRIEIHRGPKNKVTGFTVHHHMVPKPASKSGAFMENTEHSQPFSTAEHGKMMDHIDEHTSAQMGGAKAAPATEEQEPDGEEED